ncbi:glycosyltransferase involved in cell wall biosynthesis [Caldicoprobacter guelmensis]|uniref:glycosyltransferase family 2 protein n=1 Tax=Caldicoprobacter guelmensis TaxID=1170224 RepID=UPI0019571CCA|nr:glycosyltransferase family 2 protein [Caldicoprobacter guelmensis]MBM7581311.1 glycosyltransferase involved in cell wall biosynthesis [Caldicoprobacter guelmensis]
MDYPDVGVVIPAYNEGENIGSTLRALKSISCIREVVVVDDGSIDNTAQVVLKEGARLIKLERNHGKGYALRQGLKAVSSPIVLVLDADLGESAVEAVKLIQPIAEGWADVAIARFPCPPGRHGFGLVKGLSRIGVRLLTGKDLTAVLSGQRAFKREAITPEFFKYKRFGIEFGMTVDLLTHGLRVCEVDVEMTHRVTGLNFRGILHRARQFKDIFCVLVAKLLEKLGAKKAYGFD